jgi:hypothetical protein
MKKSVKGETFTPLLQQISQLSPLNIYEPDHEIIKMSDISDAYPVDGKTEKHYRTSSATQQASKSG